jgi:crossover junction endonuclease MUS81
MKLVVDNRESYLIKKFLEDSVEIDVRTLDIGDIIIEDDDGSIILIIERKTVEDLSASICDGRFREQKSRLLGNVDKSRIMYLIEGNITKPTTVKGGCDTLLGSIINTMYRDGIRVYKSSSLDETAKVIRKLFTKTDIINETKEINTTYTSTLKKKKKDNMTFDVMFHHSLVLIPQVSDKIADVIVKKYLSMSGLISAYMELKEDIRKDMLKGIEYSIKDEKTRKIGPKISERIYCFIFGV